MTSAHSTQHTAHRRVGFVCVLTAVCCLLSGCGYTTRPGLASYLRTVHVKPFVNTIDLTQLTTATNRFPIYRHGMETEVTKAVLNRFQFTGLLRPAGAEKADCRLEGELVQFRRDALRYDADQQVEEWRLSVVVNVRFYDLHVTSETPAWEEGSLTGDTTYFERGSKAESESTALDRAIQDLARRIVERVVENW
ncbi:MAG TPA: hypothetical protein DDX89_01520 [Candidatus Omnitrophica bacterium]|nr:hypothetical protein [Candidatus Omnitrophota bacterium]HBQ38561.1 hypothetical protein [Candidatus Omnitrophota bacterium]